MMDTLQRVAFIQTQCCCMNAELEAMKLANEQDKEYGRPLTYQVHDFLRLPDNYGLGHNTVISYLMER